ncbi:hypothetical protein QTP88_014972 [Uroleucon formosanum]
MHVWRIIINNIGDTISFDFYLRLIIFHEPLYYYTRYIFYLLLNPITATDRNHIVLESIILFVFTMICLDRVQIILKGEWGRTCILSLWLKNRALSESFLCLRCQSLNKS